MNCCAAELLTAFRAGSSRKLRNDGEAACAGRGDGATKEGLDFPCMRAQKQNPSTASRQQPFRLSVFTKNLSCFQKISPEHASRSPFASVQLRI